MNNILTNKHQPRIEALAQAYGEKIRGWRLDRDDAASVLDDEVRRTMTEGFKELLSNFVRMNLVQEEAAWLPHFTKRRYYAKQSPALQLEQKLLDCDSIRVYEGVEPGMYPKKRTKHASGPQGRLYPMDKRDRIVENLLGNVINDAVQAAEKEFGIHKDDCRVNADFFGPVVTEYHNGRHL